MRPGSGIGIKPRLIGLIGRPIDEPGMMVLNENKPLINGQMPTTFSDGAVFIKVASYLTTRLKDSLWRFSGIRTGAVDCSSFLRFPMEVSRWCQQTGLTSRLTSRVLLH